MMIQSWYDDDYHDDGAKIDGGNIRGLLGHGQAEMMTMMKILMTFLMIMMMMMIVMIMVRMKRVAWLVKQRRERLPFPWSISSFFQQLMADPEPPELLVIRTCILNHQMVFFTNLQYFMTIELHNFFLSTVDGWPRTPRATSYKNTRSCIIKYSLHYYTILYDQNRWFTVSPLNLSSYTWWPAQNH